jgi:hypothetical protein
MEKWASPLTGRGFGDGREIRVRTRADHAPSHLPTLAPRFTPVIPSIIVPFEKKGLV